MDLTGKERKEWLVSFLDCSVYFCLGRQRAKKEKVKGEEKYHRCEGGGGGGGREINKEASVLGRNIGFYLGTFFFNLCITIS